MDVPNLETLQELVKGGFQDWESCGDVYARYHPDFPYVLLNYTPMAAVNRRWNWLERAARGLILNTRTGEVVARPFEKFFNYGEVFPAQGSRIVEISEKLDGSLGILYRSPAGFLHIATRGSFESPQAEWATAYLRGNVNMDAIPDELTLLFEIISPVSRVVINYPYEGLFLIGGVDRFTGESYTIKQLLPVAYQANLFSARLFYLGLSMDEITSSAHKLPSNSEGWVVRFDDGLLLKVKGDEYVKLHKELSALRFQSIVELMVKAVLNDDTPFQAASRYANTLPEHHRKTVLEMAETIDAATRQFYEQCAYDFARAMYFVEDEKEMRKAFALRIQTTEDGRKRDSLSSAVLFKMFDAAPYSKVMALIYRRLFDKRNEGVLFNAEL